MNITINAITTGAKLVNIKHLEQAIMEAFSEWAEEDVNDKYMSEQFLTDKWEYPPPPTKRKNGQIAGNPRDIYDTGALFESGRESFSIKAGTISVEASWHWDAKNSSGDEYAWFVHEGQGPHSRIPRPWTDEISVPFLFATSEAKKDLEVKITTRLAK